MRSRESHQHPPKETHLHLTARDKAPLAQGLAAAHGNRRDQPGKKIKETSQGKAREKKKAGLKLLITSKQSSKESKNTGSWARAQLMPTLNNLNSALYLCCETFSGC